MSTTSSTVPPPPEQVFNSDDLVTEIFSRLPVKPILRFKTINKHLNHLLSSPSFSLRHPLRPSSALFSPSSSPSFLPLSPLSSPPPPFFSHPPPILHSSNALLLCEVVGCETTPLLLNPTTNQSIPIPLPRHPSYTLSLSFDPSRSPHYHIICVYQSSNLFSIDAYSSSTRRWRPVLIDPFSPPFDVDFERGVSCHGKLYWLSHTDTTVVFNLEKERVERLTMPSAVEGAYMERFRYFGESCGHLHLIEVRTNCVAEFHVLELEEEKEWVVRFRVDLDVVGRGFEDVMFQDHVDRFGRRIRFYAISILAVIRGDNDSGDGGGDESVIVLSVPGKVISYGFRSKESRLIRNVVDESDKWLPFKGYNAYQFIESLYCL